MGSMHANLICIIYDTSFKHSIIDKSSTDTKYFPKARSLSQLTHIALLLNRNVVLFR